MGWAALGASDRSWDGMKWAALVTHCIQWRRSHIELAAQSIHSSVCVNAPLTLTAYYYYGGMLITTVSGYK